MTEFLQLLFNGAALGARYALVALGFVIIYRATGVINFAQGGLVAVGAYLTYAFLEGPALPFALAVILAVACAALLGAGIERVNGELAQVESIKRFALLEKELDHEDGELTATQKLKRRAMEKQLAPQIEALYE